MAQIELNVLFLTIVKIEDFLERGIYSDLIWQFCQEGHRVFVISPFERRIKKNTQIKYSKNYVLLNIRTPNFQKTNNLEKGISTLLIVPLFLWNIKKYFSKVKFDLLIYSTPPITFNFVIDYIKKMNNCLSYLLLKDIFPQNAVDLKMIKNNGLLHKYFRNKEKKLYAISDNIGCMSPANVQYILKHNPQISPSKIEVNPNSIAISDLSISGAKKRSIRINNNIPINSKVFIYGGNLGKPQGINFLCDILESNKNNKEYFFLIVGSGTEFSKLHSTIKVKNISNAKLISSLPKVEYKSLVQCSDVGLIFLDPRFTIPNFPSRLLSYLENKKPVVAATDNTTDLGFILEKNGAGYWVENGDLGKMNNVLSNFVNNKEKIESMGKRGYELLRNNYSVDISYDIIMSHFS